MAKLQGNARLKAQALSLLSKGNTNTSVADHVGVHESTISRFANDDKTKAKIHALSQKYLDQCLDDVVEQDIREVKRSIEYSEAEHMYITGQNPYSYCDLSTRTEVPVFKPQSCQTALTRIDKIKDGIKKSVGMVATHTTAPVYQNILYQENNVILSEDAIRMLGASGITEPPDDIVINQGVDEDNV